MNEKLQIANERMREIQSYFLQRNADFFIVMTLEQRKHHMSMATKLDDVYQSLNAEIHQIAAEMSPTEIVKNFNECCELVQMQLAMYMRLHFDRAYLDLMLALIRAGKYYGYLLLGSIVRNMGEEATPYIVEALNNPSTATQDRALGWIAELNILEAKPVVRKLTTSENPSVASTAKITLEKLQINNK